MRTQSITRRLNHRAIGAGGKYKFLFFFFFDIGFFSFLLTLQCFGYNKNHISKKGQEYILTVLPWG